MAEAGAWKFTDDRGRTVTAKRRPERVAAYVRAGAALWDLGIPLVGVFGSAHDGASWDRAKAGGLPSAGIPYAGAGDDLNEQTLSALRPDLIVDVTYDEKNPYALSDPLGERMEEAGVPSVALTVGSEASFAGILERFAELADALGADAQAPARLAAATRLAAAEQAVRVAVAAGPVPLRVLALSAAGPEQVHVARPRTWPDLKHLMDLGVHMTDPGEGAGINWMSMSWEQAASLGADLVLADSRSNAVQPQDLTALPAWRALTAGATVEPWNPETPCSAAAQTGFFRAVAQAQHTALSNR
ncbi:ABC transporter substrate-binding protein [Streptomyces cavernicola]|uniref:ABC transporter substrate-binding protein n=1 Tax=Streptomyces cavernicola TaxID=3043613 RepID=A0ABT6SFA9_9ACTN|nr:ABC transporter substrate-binding protein [Streptomyces sp. B-S-A6]MDI3406887.1 ABC transporter substrate-binding protein [Streptomyces sp. B-S-A6]